MKLIEIFFKLAPFSHALMCSCRASFRNPKEIKMHSLILYYIALWKPLGYVAVFAGLFIAAFLAFTPFIFGVKFIDIYV